ncbi:FAD-dependent oxidoreductase [Halomarina halobia]|uniref:FAD-dependent oxidoreductase n=1 Tax=Halomarina halobia TaxID=3033386 RepID=A0ABD6ACD4_9EURY
MRRRRRSGHHRFIHATQSNWKMSETYDDIIVGGGHNGLVAALYLADEGRDVCVLERNEALGGATRSEELTLESQTHSVSSA